MKFFFWWVWGLEFRVQGSGFRIKVSIIDTGAILRFLYRVSKLMSSGCLHKTTSQIHNTKNTEKRNPHPDSCEVHKNVSPQTGRGPPTTTPAAAATTTTTTTTTTASTTGL